MRSSIIPRQLIIDQGSSAGDPGWGSPPANLLNDKTIDTRPLVKTRQRCPAHLFTGVTPAERSATKRAAQGFKTGKKNTRRQVRGTQRLERKNNLIVKRKGK